MPNRPYSQEECERVLSSEPVKKIAAALGRTVASVAQKRQQLSRALRLEPIAPKFSARPRLARPKWFHEPGLLRRLRSR